ncbi:hypothetical protein [Streptomyces sp. NPDC050988]|uniref:hypothetical protein n=1 Tax=Streptomyces sp. NPDC050988 TaxID=3365637 RepID=UPI00379D311F
MGNWVVIAQYDNDTYRTEFVRRGLETKEQALEELRAAVHTYVPSRHVVEQWRQVYRFADQESYLVVIKGRLTKWECTLRIAELTSDTNGSAVAERNGSAMVDRAQVEDGVADDDAAAAADEPQDRIPPGY